MPVQVARASEAKGTRVFVWAGTNRAMSSPAAANAVDHSTDVAAIARTSGVSGMAANRNNRPSAPVSTEMRPALVGDGYVGASRPSAGESSTGSVLALWRYQNAIGDGGADSTRSQSARRPSGGTLFGRMYLK